MKENCYRSQSCILLEVQFTRFTVYMYMWNICTMYIWSFSIIEPLELHDIPSCVIRVLLFCGMIMVKLWLLTKNGISPASRSFSMALCRVSPLSENFSSVSSRRTLTAPISAALSTELWAYTEYTLSCNSKSRLTCTLITILFSEKQAFDILFIWISLMNVLSIISCCTQLVLKISKF